VPSATSTSRAAATRTSVSRLSGEAASGCFRVRGALAAAQITEQPRRST